LITVYGIKQCDTCHKALKWLSEHAIEHQFHDVREQGLNKAQVTAWVDSDYGEELLNRRSTTWRTLSQAQKDAQGADRIQLLLDFPTLIKRPVFETDSIIAVGFSPAKLLHVLKAT
jgi:arsenate reductase